MNLKRNGAITTLKRKVQYFFLQNTLVIRLWKCLITYMPQSDTAQWMYYFCNNLQRRYMKYPERFCWFKALDFYEILRFIFFLWKSPRCYWSKKSPIVKNKRNLYDTRKSFSKISSSGLLINAYNTLATIFEAMSSNKYKAYSCFMLRKAHFFSLWSLPVKRV